MKILNIAFLGFLATITKPVTAVEEGEEACPTGEFQSCESCLDSSCGFVIDDSDCVVDCATVTDSTCYSLATSDGSDSATICALVANSTGATNTTASMPTGGSTAPTPATGATEEVICTAFESTGGKASCEDCLNAGCGYTADDGDCLADCTSVNDGAACVSGDVAVCSAESSGEEVICAAFESTGGKASCEECLAAGCGYTDDDGDCLADCSSVNDGAACVEGDVAVCSAESSGEEVICAAFESTGGKASCEECLTAGCGYTDDDGDCLADCTSVNDGAACVSGDVAVCSAESSGEEVICAAFESTGGKASCEECLTAGCGYTDDDGDCLADCSSVNDGAACVEGDVAMCASDSGSAAAASASSAGWVSPKFGNIVAVLLWAM